MAIRRRSTPALSQRCNVSTHLPKMALVHYNEAIERGPKISQRTAQHDAERSRGAPLLLPHASLSLQLRPTLNRALPRARTRHRHASPALPGQGSFWKRLRPLDIAEAHDAGLGERWLTAGRLDQCPTPRHLTNALSCPQAACWLLLALLAAQQCTAIRSLGGKKEMHLQRPVHRWGRKGTTVRPRPAGCCVLERPLLLLPTNLKALHNTALAAAGCAAAGRPCSVHLPALPAPRAAAPAHHPSFSSPRRRRRRTR